MLNISFATKEKTSYSFKYKPKINFLIPGVTKRYKKVRKYILMCKYVT